MIMGKAVATTRFALPLSRDFDEYFSQYLSPAGSAIRTLMNYGEQRPEHMLALFYLRTLLERPGKWNTVALYSGHALATSSPRVAVRSIKLRPPL